MHKVKNTKMGGNGAMKGIYVMLFDVFLHMKYWR